MTAKRAAVQAALFTGAHGAREIIARGVADVFAASNREHLPSRSVRDWSAAWLDAKRLESATTTASRYEGIIQRFTDDLGRKADRDVASLTAADAGGFRDSLAKDLSRASGNLAVKVLRMPRLGVQASSRGITPSLKWTFLARVVGTRLLE